ncbi:MAG: hypothetical protein AAF889_01745 [Cyanobacteria bacterium P01_D01_bin.73]
MEDGSLGGRESKFNGIARLLDGLTVQGSPITPRTTQTEELVTG